jgi:arginine repressor
MTKPARRPDPEREGRRGRRARAIELQDKWERSERARRLRAGEKAHYAGADRAELKAAQSHHKRALNLHQAASQVHGNLSRGIDELKSIHDRATQALAELGQRSANSKISRALDSLGRCMRSMRVDSMDQNDNLDNLGTSLGKASQCVDTVLDTDADEPAAGVAQ